MTQSGFGPGAIVRLNKKFRRAPDAMKRRAKAALAVGASELAAAQKRAAPVDDGELRASIRHEVAQRDIPAARVYVNYREGNGPRAPHAHLVEFGAAPHTIGGKIRHPGAKAQPFFYPIYRLYRSRIRRRVARAGKAAAQEIARGS